MRYLILSVPVNPHIRVMLIKSRKKACFTVKPLRLLVELIIIITNMLLYAESDKVRKSMDMHSGTFNPQDFAWKGLR